MTREGDSSIRQDRAVKQILFVCSENTCRSPMAAAMVERLIARVKGLRHIDIGSAGVLAVAGSPASANAVEAMRQMRLDLSKHRARQVSQELIEPVDLILAMTTDHRSGLTRSFPTVADRVLTLGEFAGDGGDVRDPHGQGLAVYQQCAARLRELVGGAVARLAEVSEPSLFEPVLERARGRLFRVSRPGRGACGGEETIPEEVVRAWVNAVRRKLDVTVGSQHLIEVEYVCLLGEKADGRDEIADFYDGCEPGGAAPVARFEGLLNSMDPARLRFRIHHFPTTDHQPVPEQTRAQVVARIDALLLDGRTVLVGCSAAVGRTGRVLAHLKAKAPHDDSL